MLRRLTRPWQRFFGLLVLAALPLAAALGVVDREAFAAALRVAFIFIVLMLAFRLLGKRELSRLSPFELVTLMLIPEVLSEAMQKPGMLVVGLAGLSALLFMVMLTSLLAHRSRLFSRVVQADPSILVYDGKLCEDAMNRERIQPDELASEMHARGFEHVSEIQWALLESGGNISFIPKSHAVQKPTPEQPAGETQ